MPASRIGSCPPLFTSAGPFDFRFRFRRNARVQSTSLLIVDYERIAGCRSPLERRAVGYVRRAALYATVGALVYFVDVLAEDVALYGLRRTVVVDVDVFFAAAALAVVGVALWLRGSALFRLAFTVLHRLAAGRVSLSAWNDAAFEALWRLPRAALAGAVLFAVYWGSRDWPWPSGIRSPIFGTIANVVGAWCYLPILWRWWELRAGGRVIEVRQEWKT